MQPGGRLEAHAGVAARGHERRDRLDRRERLRPPPQRIFAPAPASCTAATSPRRPRPGGSSPEDLHPLPQFRAHQRLRVRDPGRVDPRLDQLDRATVERAAATASRSPSPPSSTTLSRGASRGSSPRRDAGQMKRSSIHACSLARAARSAAIASGMSSEAGGNSAAWSIRRPSSARRASWLTPAGSRCAWPATRAPCRRSGRSDARARRAGPRAGRPRRPPSRTRA